jgi:hypothetical protein
MTLENLQIFSTTNLVQVDRYLLRTRTHLQASQTASSAWHLMENNAVKRSNNMLYFKMNQRNRRGGFPHLSSRLFHNALWQDAPTGHRTTRHNCTPFQRTLIPDPRAESTIISWLSAYSVSWCILNHSFHDFLDLKVKLPVFHIAVFSVA